MAKTIRAVFDGEVLRPEQPTGLQPQKTYEITIEREVSPQEDSSPEEYPLTQIVRLATDLGIDDLATGHDRYAHRQIERKTENA